MCASLSRMVKEIVGYVLECKKEENTIVVLGLMWGNTSLCIVIKKRRRVLDKNRNIIHF